MTAIVANWCFSFGRMLKMRRRGAPEAVTARSAETQRRMEEDAW